MSPRILLVEDEDKLAKFVQLALSYEGYAVDVANDGLTGLMTARDKDPDLIIIDWMMPGLMGSS
jgi:two-component system OmpR family response regulator